MCIYFSYIYSTFWTASKKNQKRISQSSLGTILQRGFGFVEERKKRREKRADHLISIRATQQQLLSSPLASHWSSDSYFIRYDSKFIERGKRGKTSALGTMLFLCGVQGRPRLTVCQSPSLHRYREGQSASRQLWLDAGLERWEQLLSSGLRRAPTWQKTCRRRMPSPHDAEHWKTGQVRASRAFIRRLFYIPVISPSAWSLVSLMTFTWCYFNFAC